MSEWEVLTLGDCADWYSGGTPKTSVSEYWGGDIPWITASSLHNFYIRNSERRVTPLGLEHGTRLVPKDTILFVVRGMSLKTEFRVGITCRPVTFGQDCKALIPKAGIAPLFLANVLRGRAEEILGLVDEASHGTGRLATDVLKDFKIWVPPLDEQARIAAVLSCLDRKIENLRRQNETLEQIAQTLFKHWFVDFEFPNEDGKPYKSSGGEMVRSELGEIPAGWRIGKLGDEVETLGGGTPSTQEPEYWVDGDIPWYSPTDLTKSNTLFSLSSEKQITQLGLDKSSAKLFPKYSLLLTSRATIGEITINTQDACTNQGFITLVPNKTFSIYFLHGWLLTQINLIKQLASGSTFPELSKSTFRNFSFLIPDSVPLTKYNQVVKPVFQKIENNIRQIQTLTKTRDVLLPKLMSGKLRITEI